MTLGQRLQVTRRSLVTLHKATRSPTTSRKRQDTAAPSAAAALVAQEGDEAPSSPIRLAKRIAMSGLCSRRAAEKRIRSADVTVNGRVVDDVATVVDVARDVVAVDGRALAKTQQRTMWMAHKMKGVRGLILLLLLLFLLLLFFHCCCCLRMQWMSGRRGEIESLTDV